jgi:hypothetical protein
MFDIFSPSGPINAVEVPASEHQRSAMFFRIRTWLAVAILASANRTSVGLSVAGHLTARDGFFSNSFSGAVEIADEQKASSISVTEFGAKGDCSGNGATANCTDNANAIQQAIDHCYAKKCAVFFPANPAQKGQTVYYTGHPINPKGVAIEGPGGAGGSANSAPGGIPVAVRGAPGKDVFAVGDPTGADYVAPLRRAVVRRLGIIVDDSVDASAKFPHRLPGRTCYDGTISASNLNVLSSSKQCLFQGGDQTQNIVIYGAGKSACPGGTASNCLITTVANFTSPGQVTLSASATGAVTEARVYVAVDGLPVTQTVGNCAYAYDSWKPDEPPTPEGPLTGAFEDLVVTVTSGSPVRNHSCGFFFQGRQGPYQTIWSHDYIGAEFPFVAATAPGDPSDQPSGSISNGIQDYNLFEHVWMGGSYSFITYAGGFNNLRDIQLSQTQYGPTFIKAFGGEKTSPSHWYIDIPEIEWSLTAKCGPGWTNLRLAGAQNVVERLGSQYCAPANLTMQIDASDTDIRRFMNVSVVTVNITGERNRINQTSTIGHKLTWNDTGYGNTYLTELNAGTLDSKQPMRDQFAGGNAVEVGPPTLAHDRPAFERTGDFINKGGAAYYLNDFDLWIWPNEAGNLFGGSTPQVISDSASETGTAILLPAGFTESTLAESNGTFWMIGSQVPATKLRVLMSAKASTANTHFQFDAMYVSGNSLRSLGCKFSASPATLTTTYAVYACDVDATGFSGQRFGVHLGNGAATSANIQIAWIGIRPWTSDLPTESLQIGSGAVITGNQGNGPLVLHSAGTAKAGDMLSFDGNGNAVDSGVPASRRIAENGGSDPANPGDLLCAHAADTTIHAVSISGSPGCNGTTCTLSGNSIPADYAIPNQLIGVTGTSGVKGLNGGPYAITSFTPDSLTFNYNAASGIPSGGAFYRWCENHGKDAITMADFSRTSIAVPPNSLAADTNYQHRAQMLLTTTAPAPLFSVQMKYGTVSLYRTSVHAGAGQIDKPSQLTVNMLPLAIGSSGVIESSLQSLTLSGSNSDFGDLDAGIQIANTAVKQTLQVGVAFSATGVESISKGSGGAVSGAGTCTLSRFNGGGAGASATVNFAKSGSWTDATIQVSNTGYGYTSAPTTAALSSGTAKCSGAATLITKLGGAQGNAVELIGLQ